jgi:hypothetical protein
MFDMMVGEIEGGSRTRVGEKPLTPEAAGKGEQSTPAITSRAVQ